MKNFKLTWKNNFKFFFFIITFWKTAKILKGDPLITPRLILIIFLNHPVNIVVSVSWRINLNLTICWNLRLKDYVCWKNKFRKTENVNCCYHVLMSNTLKSFESQGLWYCDKEYIRNHPGLLDSFGQAEVICINGFKQSERLRQLN